MLTPRTAPKLAAGTSPELDYFLPSLRVPCMVVPLGVLGSTWARKLVDPCRFMPESGSQFVTLGYQMLPV